MPRDDPLPLATMAAELLARAAKKRLAADGSLERILQDLSLALPILRADEPHVMLWTRYATALREAERAAEKEA